MRMLLALILLLPVALQAAGLGVYNPAQHAVNGFMPTQLPGLVAWFAADSINLANGESVNWWNDLSANAFYASNATSSTQPTITSANGRKAVLFDGVDDRLAVPGISEAKFQTNTYFTVAVAKKTASVAVEHCIWYLGNDSTYSPNYNYRALMMFGETNRSFEKVFLGNYANPTEKSTSGSTTLTTNLYNVISGFVSYVGGTNVVFLNGSQDGTLSGAVYPIINTNAYAFIGKRGQNSEGFLKGAVAEIIIYNVVPSKSDILAIHRYVGTKYGIVVQ